MHPNGDSRSSRVLENPEESGIQDRMQGEDELQNSQPPGDKHPVVAALAVLGVATWCISVMAIGVNLAESAWEWAWVLAFGTAIPVALLWQANRLLSPPATPRPVSRDKKERELLQALGERGELTPITAAIQTSLTADEAAGMLEELTRKGYLSLLVEEGIQAYALREQDRRGLPEMGPATSDFQVEGSKAAPQPLDDPLSERELEVLVLLASGRTNSEIARDLFVTVGTIKSHTSNVYRKLGTRNRAEALVRARDLKLLP